MANKQNDPQFMLYDIAEDLDSPEVISYFLKSAMETENEEYIAKAIGVVIRAQNMSEIARKVGISRQSLYNIAHGETKTSFGTMVNILHAVGVSLQPVAKKM